MKLLKRWRTHIVMCLCLGEEVCKMFQITKSPIFFLFVEVLEKLGSSSRFGFPCILSCVFFLVVATYEFLQLRKSKVQARNFLELQLSSVSCGLNNIRELFHVVNFVFIQDYLGRGEVRPTGCDI